MFKWQFGYSVGRHTHAGAVELPSYSLRRIKSADWAYAATAIGLMVGDAIYDSLLDYVPCVYWERHCYYFSLCSDMDKSKVYALREFVALGFRGTRCLADVSSVTGSVPVDLDSTLVDSYVLQCILDWEQLLRARWHELQATRGVVRLGSTLALPVKARGTYYDLVNVVEADVKSLKID